MERVKKKIEKYQKAITEILQAEARNFSLQPELQDHIVTDKEHNHFQLLRIGWVDDDRILQILIHIDIKPDGKVWIQENLTELAVDDELVKKGVPPTDIVLGMHPPSYRKFTEFAES